MSPRIWVVALAAVIAALTSSVRLGAQAGGGTWTFTVEVGGVKGRTTVNLSGDNYTSTYEYAGADGKWVTASANTAVKMK